MPHTFDTFPVQYLTSLCGGDIPPTYKSWPIQYLFALSGQGRPWHDLIVHLDKVGHPEIFTTIFERIPEASIRSKDLWVLSKWNDDLPPVGLTPDPTAGQPYTYDMYTGVVTVAVDKFDVELWGTTRCPIPHTHDALKESFTKYGLTHEELKLYKLTHDQLKGVV